jgi:isoamylase
MSPKILPGCADLLGATPNAAGTNFAVSSGGDEVALCLFDAGGAG